jgi:hypothetical protein
LLNDALYLNPSYVSFSQNYGISANYFYFHSETPGYNGHNYNISIQDGSPDIFFQAGIGLTHRSDSTIFSFGASKAFVNKYGVGIGAKAIFPADGTNSQFFDFNISATGKFLDWLTIALLIDNIVESDPARRNGFLREITIGTKFNAMNIVIVYLDPHWAPSVPGLEQLGYEGGLEFPLFYDFYLRAGGFQNTQVDFANRRENGLGVGIGWFGPKISFDYAYRRIFSPLPANCHTFSLTIFF